MLLLETGDKKRKKNEQGKEEVDMMETENLELVGDMNEGVGGV